MKLCFVLGFMFCFKWEIFLAAAQFAASALEAGMLGDGVHVHHLSAFSRERLHPCLLPNRHFLFRKMLFLKVFPCLKGTQHSLPLQLVQACRNCWSAAANCAFRSGCVQFRPICAQPRDGSCVFKMMITLPNPIRWEHQAALLFSPLFSVSNPQERLWGATPEYWLFKGKMDVVLFHLWYQ